MNSSLNRLRRIPAWGGRSLAAIGVLSLLSSLVPSPVRAQAPAPIRDRGTPVPVAQSLSAVKGQPVTIELKSTPAAAGLGVEFLVRDFPTQGHLGIITNKPSAPHEATVVYSPNPDSLAGSDGFTFCVRHPGGLYSATVTVNITLSDPAPVIETVGQVLFGRVTLGESATREIILKNVGTDTYRETLTLSGPWAVASPKGAIVLPPGGQTKLALRFTPEAPGITKHTLSLHDAPNRGIALIGDAYAPFEPNARTLELTWNPSTRNREATLHLMGRSTERVPVIVDAGNRLESLSGSRLSLERGEQKTLAFVLPASDVAEFEGTVRLTTSAGYLQVIAVKAPPVPPLVDVRTPGRFDGLIDFGEVKGGESAVSEVTLSNRGGTPAKVILELEAPFATAGKEREFEVAPGSSLTIPLNVNVTQEHRGLIAGNLRVRSGSDFQDIRMQAIARNTDVNLDWAEGGNLAVSQKIPDAAEAGSFEASSKVAAMLPTDPRTVAERSPTGFMTRPIFYREASSTVPAVESYDYVSRTPNTITIGWDIPSPTQETYELDVRAMRYSKYTQQIESVWLPYHDVIYERDGARMLATVQGLEPNRVYEFRVFSAGPNGTYSAPSEALGILTSTPVNWKTPLTWSTVFLLLSVLGIYVGRWWWWYRSWN